MDYSSSESQQRRITKFVDGSPAGLVQLLIALASRDTFTRIIDCPTYPVPAHTPGLSEAVIQIQELLHEPKIHAPTLFANLYSSVQRVEARKQTGQFFTSAEVAGWALDIAPPCPEDHVCDAGAGCGVFAEAIFRSGRTISSYIGVEIDPVLALCGAHVLENINAPKSYKIWYANFLLLGRAAFTAKGLPHPTLIIANPPFIRFHNLSNRARLRSALKSSLGIDLSSFSGTGGYFLTRAADLVGSASTHARGCPRRLMFFLPSEASGAAHAQRLRDDLLYHHGWKHRRLRIPNGQTGIDRHPSNTAALLYVFEQKRKAKRRSSQSQRNGIALHDILKIRRGLSTGRNDFFVMTEEEVSRRKIDKKWLRAVLPTRIHLPERCITRVAWNSLREAGHPCWLLSIRPDEVKHLDAAVEDYLRDGVRRGVHATPTATTLRCWFCLPIPDKVPDVFVTYFFRGAPRFVLNRAGVLNLTNILGGQFTVLKLDSAKTQAVVDLLNIEANRWKAAGREYKRGLRKIEPRELSMLTVSEAILDVYQPKQLMAKATTGKLFD